MVVCVCLWLCMFLCVRVHVLWTFLSKYSSDIDMVHRRNEIYKNLRSFWKHLFISCWSQQSIYLESYYSNITMNVIFWWQYYHGNSWGYYVLWGENIYTLVPIFRTMLNSQNSLLCTVNCTHFLHHNLTYVWVCRMCYHTIICMHPVHGSNARSWVLKLTQCTDACDQVHNTYTHTRTRTYAHTHTRAPMYTHMHPCMHAYTHTNTHLYTTHTHIHGYTHI